MKLEMLLFKVIKNFLYFFMQLKFKQNEKRIPFKRSLKTIFAEREI